MLSKVNTLPDFSQRRDSISDQPLSLDLLHCTKLPVQKFQFSPFIYVIVPGNVESFLNCLWR